MNANMYRENEPESAVDYYNRTKLERETIEFQKAEEIARKRGGQTDFLVNGPGVRTETIKLVAPTKERLTPAKVSGDAEAAIRRASAEAFSVLENMAIRNGLKIKKGDFSTNVASPVPGVPHYKETTVAGIATGRDTMLVITMSNIPAERVEVSPDGKLYYHNIKRPEGHGGPLDDAKLQIRGVRRNANGSYQSVPGLTDNGQAWKHDNVEAVAKAVLDAAKRGGAVARAPSMAVQDDKIVRQSQAAAREQRLTGQRQAFGRAFA